MLFEKHDEDAAKLVELEKYIDRHHYTRADLDTKFDKLERACIEGFKSLGDKFDELSKAMRDCQLKGGPGGGCDSKTR